MTAPYQFFEELLFGEGFWLGLIIIVALGLFIASRVKYSGILFVIIYIFLAIEYLETIAVDSNHMWAVIVCIVAMIFSTYQLYHDVQSN